MACGFGRQGLNWTCTGMTRWLILLRAVNVSGVEKLVMADLASALMEDGFHNVQSYLISGNIILDSALNADDVRLSCNRVLNMRFNLSGERCLVRDLASLHHTIKSNPFRDAAQYRPQMLHVHFCAATPQSNAEINLTSYKGVERLRLEGAQVFIDYVNGTENSALTPRFLDTALGTAGTSRNWNTLLQLGALMREGQ
jgi:uncharacterized protein (DUF1697 family)